jgi:uncharacterized protein (PEP-CTERM system associated)
MAHPAFAERWRITPSIGVQETFTDNVNGASSGQEQSEFVTTVTPGVSVRGSGGRVSLNFNYGLSYLDYLHDRGDDEFRNNLTGSSRVELFRDVLFLNARASVSQQFTNNTGAISESESNDLTNRTEVRAFSLNPVIRHHFGNWADSEASYTFNRFDSGSDSASNSSSNSASLRLNSGRRFTKFRWGVSTNRSESGADNAVQNVNGNLQYVVNRKISLLGGFGFEDITDSTLNSTPSGMIWNVGLRLTPGPRTSITVNYNDRYDTQFVSLDASHRLGARTNVSVRYSESIQTSQGVVAQQLDFLGINDDGVLIDTRTGLPFVGGDSAFGLTDNSFRQKQFNASLSGSRKRNTYAATAFREVRETDATGLTEIALGGSVSFGRRWTRKANSNFSLSYRNTDYGTADGREDDSINAAASFSYRIYKDVNGTITYNLSKRDSNVGDNDITENAVTLRLSKTF